MVCCRSVPVLSIGELLLDCVEGDCRPGGAPANVCSALVKLGTGAGLLGRVGEDSDGKALRELVGDLGVDVSGVTFESGRPTRRVVVSIQDNGDRVFEGFHGGENVDFADACLRYEGGITENVKILVTGTLALAFPTSAKALRDAVSAARQNAAVVITDVNWRPVFWTESDMDEARREIVQFLMDCANVVKISDDEVEFLFGTKPDDALDRPQDVLDIFRDGNVLGILITGGPKGASYAFCRGDGSIMSGRVKGFAVNAVDTIGAGDAFSAGFVSEICRIADQSNILSTMQTLKAEELHKAVQFACAAGAITTSAFGAMDPQPTRAEVDQFLRKWSNVDQTP